MITTRTTDFHDYKSWISNGGNYSRETLDYLVHAMKADVDNAKHSGEGRLRPSLIGDPCDRKQVLSFLHSGGSSFNGSWEAWSGTWLHLGFQSYLLDRFPTQLRIEHKVRPRQGSLGVTGKADWYWYGPPEIGDLDIISGPHIGDYKTIWSLKAVDKEPKAMHVQQLLYEMYTLGTTKGYLVYQNRSFGGDMATWMLQAEDEDFKACEERLIRLHNFTATGVLPDLLTPCKSMSGPYLDCDWRDTCMAAALKETVRE